MKNKKIIIGKADVNIWFQSLERERLWVIESIAKLKKHAKIFESLLSNQDYKKFKKKIDRIYELRETLIKNK